MSSAILKSKFSCLWLWFFITMFAGWHCKGHADHTSRFDVSAATRAKLIRLIYFTLLFASVNLLSFFPIHWSIAVKRPLLPLKVHFQLLNPKDSITADDLVDLSFSWSVQLFQRNRSRFYAIQNQWFYWDLCNSINCLEDKRSRTQ